MNRNSWIALVVILLLFGINIKQHRQLVQYRTAIKNSNAALLKAAGLSQQLKLTESVLYLVLCNNDSAIYDLAPPGYLINVDTLGHVSFVRKIK